MSAVMVLHEACLGSGEMSVSILEKPRLILAKAFFDQTKSNSAWGLDRQEGRPDRRHRLYFIIHDHMRSQQGFRFMNLVIPFGPGIQAHQDNHKPSLPPPTYRSLNLTDIGEALGLLH